MGTEFNEYLFCLDDKSMALSLCEPPMCAVPEVQPHLPLYLLYYGNQMLPVGQLLNPANT